MENNRKRLTVMSYLPKLQITLVIEKKIDFASWCLFDRTY